MQEAEKLLNRIEALHTDLDTIRKVENEAVDNFIEQLEKINEAIQVANANLKSALKSIS